MHLDLSLLTALAVFVHLGTSLAGTFMKDSADRQKLAKIDAGVDQLLGVAEAVSAQAVSAQAKGGSSNVS